MSCYHPLHQYFQKYSDGSEKHIFVDDNSVLPFTDGYGNTWFNSRDVPCGQCIGCRLDRSREWALRCMLEAREHKNNVFVTLTYDDEHLPFNGNFQLDNYGEIVTDVIPTLQKTDVQLYIKRLRSRLQYQYGHDGLRVYYCGEYGSKTQRPHYHLILFNLPDLEYTLVSRSCAGYPLFSNEIISDCWNKGFVVCGEVNYETCAYTARYIMKKALGKYADVYQRLCIDPEFVCMSRNPGIARNYYDEESHKFYEFDKITITGSDGKPLVAKPPRYFDKLFDIDDPVRMDQIKKARARSAEESEKVRSLYSSLSKEQYLCLQEGNKISSLKKLTRGLE